MRRRPTIFASLTMALVSCPALADVPAPAAVAGQAPPAARRTATRIPEPDTIALFLLGASGLLVGRRLSRTGRRSPDA